MGVVLGEASGDFCELEVLLSHQPGEQRRRIREEWECQWEAGGVFGYVARDTGSGRVEALLVAAFLTPEAERAIEPPRTWPNPAFWEIAKRARRPFLPTAESSPDVYAEARKTGLCLHTLHFSWREEASPERIGLARTMVGRAVVEAVAGAPMRRFTVSAYRKENQDSAEQTGLKPCHKPVAGWPCLFEARADPVRQSGDLAFGRMFAGGEPRLDIKDNHRRLLHWRRLGLTNAESAWRVGLAVRSANTTWSRLLKTVKAAVPTAFRSGDDWRDLDRWLDANPCEGWPVGR